MAVINKEIAYMALPLSIRRGNPFPLDEYSVWYDMDELNTYASSSPVAYVGQIVVYVNESSSTVEAYMIQNQAGSLIKLASTTASGDLTQDVQELQGKVSNLETAVGTKSEESSITASSLWDAIEEVKSAYESAITALGESVDEKIATAISSVYTPAGTVAFEALPPLGADQKGKVYNISNDFVTTEDFVEGAGKNYTTGTNVVCVEVEAPDYKWDVLAGTFDNSGLVTDEELTAGLDKKVDKVDGSRLMTNEEGTKLSGIEEGAQANKIDGASNEFEIGPEDKILSIKAVEMSKVTGLPEALAKKVDAVEGKQLSTEDYTTEDKNKLAGISDGANANLIEIIKLGGQAAEISDKAVDIPVATQQALGLVKSSSAENGIEVAEDGTMTVHSLNIDKLTQTEGDVLILDGGSSAAG